jgi:hypothetical protein
MRRILLLLRFFWTVPPIPPLMAATFAAVALAGVAQIVFQPLSAARALVPLLLLQLFAASSGFAVPARRGHYDFILTTGASRAWIAGAHWAMSIVPGLLGWAVLACAELVVTRGTGASIASSGSVAALAVISTLPWAFTVALPRFAAAIGWLLALVLVTVNWSGDGTLRVLEAAGDRSWMETAITLLLYPPLLLGESVAGPQRAIVLSVLLISIGAMAYAFVWIDRRDIPLETAQ